MPLYIKNEHVADLATRVARELGVDKTEAVRRALDLQLQTIASAESLVQRVARVQARAREAGLRADGADDKGLMDDLSGGV